MATEEADPYVHEMDWGAALPDQGHVLANYRRYQYNLISKYVGQNVLEVGTGDRGFTDQLVRNAESLQRLVSIEPSETLYTLYAERGDFPNNVLFKQEDLFRITEAEYALFDTAVMIHVLEHIEDDKYALEHIHTLLSPGGHLLIEVPALPFLFSVHDERLGHYRRYTKKTLLSVIDRDAFEVLDIWYQDPVGVLGSLYFFKLRKIKLKSTAGAALVGTEGRIYDRWIIPLQAKVERYVRFPFGLSLTAVLRKR